ncbi:MAG: cytotoxin [Clostridia bacterium]|nr:cytotoxin [Clostridia bacterium]
MMYKLKYTKDFEKNLKSLTQQEQKLVANKLKLLIQNPFYPSLRTKKVQGLDNVFEMSVNMDIRILWKYENGIIILLLDVGHHKNILGL